MPPKIQLRRKGRRRDQQLQMLCQRGSQASRCHQIRCLSQRELRLVVLEMLCQRGFRIQIRQAVLKQPRMVWSCQKATALMRHAQAQKQALAHLHQIAALARLRHQTASQALRESQQTKQRALKRRRQALLTQTARRQAAPGLVQRVTSRAAAAAAKTAYAASRLPKTAKGGRAAKGVAEVEAWLVAGKLCNVADIAAATPHPLLVVLPPQLLHRLGRVREHGGDDVERDVRRGLARRVSPCAVWLQRRAIWHCLRCTHAARRLCAAHDLAKGGGCATGRDYCAKARCCRLCCRRLAK